VKRSSSSGRGTRRRTPHRTPPKRSSAPRSPRRSSGRPPKGPLLLNVLVRDIMTRDVVTVGWNASLFDALVLMRTRQVSGFPVLNEQGAVVSVLSQSDIARALNGSVPVPDIRSLLDVLVAGFGPSAEPIVRSFHDRLLTLKVGDVVGGTLVSIDSESTVESAAEAMTEQKVHRLPVLRGNELVGIVTRHDIVRALVRPSGGR
jgi:CBS domain-containing protein